MTELQSASDKLDNKVEDKLVLEDKDGVICNNAANEYLMGIRGDLKQAERLVSDAVNNLVCNFRYISKLTGSHHEMVLAIERMAPPERRHPISGLLEKQMVIANRIEQELDAVITSLQFGDLVAQLLEHTARQVEILSDELRRIDRQGRDQKRYFKSMPSEINKAVNGVKNMGKKKPVVQQGMKMGDIELF